jgi:hypothetical protein
LRSVSVTTRNRSFHKPIISSQVLIARFLKKELFETTIHIFKLLHKREFARNTPIIKDRGLRIGLKHVFSQISQIFRKFGHSLTNFDQIYQSKHTFQRIFHAQHEPNNKYKKKYFLTNPYRKFVYFVPKIKNSPYLPISGFKIYFSYYLSTK